MGPTSGNLTVGVGDLDSVLMDLGLGIGARYSSMTAKDLGMNSRAEAQS